MKIRKTLYGLFVGTLLMNLFSFTSAWFMNRDQAKNESLMGSSISNYYARGNGTEEDPFILNKPIHVYNFSWLTNKGTYDGRKVYFELGADIDMAGAISGSTTTTGAIPPIGTTSHPFIGNFEGNGYVISNAWVSSNPNDWKEKPLNYETVNIGTDIGFFGRVSSYGEGANEIIGTAHDFYLENIEITSNVNNSNVGVVAGYLDGNFKRIGVKNAKINTQNAINNYSRFSLIGRTDQDVDIGNVPKDTAGGDLIVNPTVEGNFSVTSGKRQIPGSVEDRAYYVSSLNSVSPSPIKSEIFGWNAGEILFSTARTVKTYRATTSNMSAISSSSLEPECANAVGSVNKKFIQFNAAPDFTNTVDGLPANSVWFSPLQGGTCVLAFCRTTKSSDETMSLYRIQKVESGNRITYNVVDEIIFNFPKSNSFKNGENVYFKIKLTNEEVQGYSFCIGKTRNASGSSAGFFFLKLAGANIEDGGSELDTGKALDLVDFVTVTNIDFTTYTVHTAQLAFNVSTNSTVNMFYNAQNDGKIHYSYTPTTEQYVQDKISSGNASLYEAYNTNTFPLRIES